MDARRLAGVGVGVLLVLAGCGQGQPGGEPSPTLSLDWEKMEQQRIAASQRAEARASASATASPTPTGPYVWKEIPEPTLPPEAQAQAGFAEAELAAKYFVELQYYVAQTNDLATWEQVVSSDSTYGQNVAQKSENRGKHRVRASYEKVQVDAVKALRGSEDNSVFKVLCKISILAESAVNENGEIVKIYGDSNYYIVAFVRFSEGSWTFLEGDSFDETPEGF